MSRVSSKTFFVLSLSLSWGLSACTAMEWDDKDESQVQQQGPDVVENPDKENPPGEQPPVEPPVEEVATWRADIQPLLQAKCGGCHGGAQPAAGLQLKDADAHDNLFGPSKQKPAINLIEPGNPEGSYIWMKLNALEGIGGKGMPLVPQQGYVPLAAEELKVIEAWIQAGASKE